MKKLFLILCILVMVPIAHADFLVVDNPATFTPTVTEVEVNGAIVPSICTFGSDEIGDYVRILDVTTFTTGQYTFKARWHDGSGWWSDWSDPFVAGKPGVTGNARIVEE